MAVSTASPPETAGIPAEARPTTRRRTRLMFVILTLVLIAATLVSAMIGQVSISPTEVIGSILQHAGVHNDWASHDQITDATLWVVRFPRVLMAVVVGAALAVAGSVMQAIFGNPLAEPGVVGVSSGAALGAALSIVLGVTVLGGWSTAVFAFVGGFGAVLLVYIVSRSRGRTEVVTLILTGIAVNAFAGAGIAFLVFAADKAGREQIVFWQLGSLNGSLGSEAGIVGIVAVLGTAVAFWLAPRYDLLALGERNARHLGVNVEGLRIVSVVLVALLTGAAVAFCGIIAFVGLVVPHLLRTITGPGHRVLLPASALGGALLLTVADTIARNAIPDVDLPIGMLTAFVGGPFFLWQLRRTRARSGGWA